MVDDAPDGAPMRAGASPGPSATATEMVGPAAFRTETDGEVVIHVEGELDAQSGAHLRTLLTRAFEGSPTAVVVELAELDFIDSVGLSVLVAAHNRGEAEGIPFQLLDVSPPCRRVFEITRLVDVFDLR